MKTRTIAIAAFKAQCLSLLDEVSRTREELVITKRGKPIARVLPLERAVRAPVRVKLVGDVVGPIEPEWIA